MNALPETAGVPWRARVDARRLTARGHLWTATAVAHSVPFAAVACVLFVLEPWSFPVGLALLAHGWGIPEIYANRGAKVLKARPRGAGAAEGVAAGLVGDLVDHDQRELFARTGLVVERARLGTWVLGEAGAVLVRPGGRRVDCWCVRADAADLPAGDRVAHLLLALREDESGLATVANMAFSGAPWRLRRRLAKPARLALDAALVDSRSRGDRPGHLTRPRA